jgi:phosphoribosylaminoimidazole-succinocarboxamide synthase
MGLEKLALAKTDDFPIRKIGSVHSGKVRSVYWLPTNVSNKLAESRGYDYSKGMQYAVMVISDRISAFDVNWKAEDGLDGVPGKGATLNMISEHYFGLIKSELGIENHLVDTPHPLVWIVEKAQPIMVEGIARGYITGSMLGAYKKHDFEKGVFNFCGYEFRDGLKPNQKFSVPLYTPTTKGTMRGLSELGVPEKEDANVTQDAVSFLYKEFGFNTPDDCLEYKLNVVAIYSMIRENLAKKGQIFVDTKFEMGYNHKGEMILIDEVATPDSSRYWDAEKYEQGIIVENSKEGFRGFLKTKFGESMTSKDEADIAVKKVIAANYRVPVEEFNKVSSIYGSMANLITGRPVPNIENPKEEIMQALSEYKLLK